MAESGCWRLTVVGGAENGKDFVLPGDRPVVIGRSHSADMRLTEPDVSGRHIELVADGGSCKARNLSRFASRINGVEMASGAEGAIKAGDAIEIGRRVKIRVDAVPMQAAPAQQVEDDDYDAPTAVMEEASTASQENAFFAPDGESETSATRVASETFATKFASASDIVTSPSSGASSGAAFAPDDSDDGETVIFGGAQGGTDDEEETGDGETRELETRIGSMEEIIQRRKELEKKSKFRKVAAGFGFVCVAALLTGLWFISRTTKETYEMSYPKDAHGRPDAASYILRDASRNALIEVDYPRNQKMSVTVAPDGNGITVVSFMGRDRDVPFFLQTEATSNEDELKLSLMQSVRAWLARMEASGGGFVFDEMMKHDLEPSFFEVVFPDSCQSKTLYGVRFVMFEYKRTWPDGKLWHGIAIYFRRGDTVFVHRREIPEFYWERGGYRIKKDPNIAIYSNLIDSYWESPGTDDLPLERTVPELMSSIRNILSKERASDWRFLKKDIDAVLIKTWRGDSKTRDFAEGCLRQFREVLRRFYYGKYNAYINAKDNRDERRCLKFRQDCKSVFDDPSERYYYLLGNGEVW